MADAKICAVAGCGKIEKLRRGLCFAHYRKALRYGDAEVSLKASPGSGRAWLDARADYDGEECLIWPFGTGRVRPEVRVDGKRVRAFRYMCEAAHGPPPPGHIEAAHNCGKGHEGCVNPRHLRWDTPSGNQADRVEHGTHRRGDRQWQAKLSEAEVRQIRDLAAGPMKQSAIAEMFGVHQSTVSEIKTRRKWGWLN